MKKIKFLATQGTLFSSITTLMDAFSIAQLWHHKLAPEYDAPIFDSKIVTADGKPVEAWGGIKIFPDEAISDSNDADYVIISPFFPHKNPEPENLSDIIEWLKYQHDNGTKLASVCTGTFLLARTGLLDNRSATTNWQFANMFNQQFPQVTLDTSKMLTIDGLIITTGATSAVYNLALYIIEQSTSHHLADACSKALLMDPGRTSQAPYMISPALLSHDDKQIETAQELMKKEFASKRSIDDIAQCVGISPRHFKRRFKKATGVQPIKYLQQVRISGAKKQLETTRKTVEEITLEVGYSDISSFCRLFKQQTGLSPKSYREKFFKPNSQTQQG